LYGDVCVSQHTYTQAIIVIYVDDLNKGAIKVSWISTNDQAADGLTKALNRVKFARFKELIRVVDCTSAIKSATTSTKKGVS
jgi:hypothetical protein